MISTIDGQIISAGDTVWVENVKGAPGECMLAKVITTDLERGQKIGFWFGTYASEECVMVEQVGTPAMPVLNDEPWVTRWPAALLLATDAR